MHQFSLVRCASGLALALVLSLCSVATASTPDLPTGDEWRPACSGNYSVSSRPASYPIQKVVIHKVQGSAAGAASWFQNCSSNVSAHYIFNNSSGYCYQSVREKDIAYHARSANSTSIGIEHGGYVTSNDTADICYQESAIATRSCVIYYGVPLDRAHIVGHSELPDNDHTDPGIYWNWNVYMAYVASGGQPSTEEPVLLPDGRLALLSIFTDGSVQVNAQTAPGSSWGGWGNLGGSGFNVISGLNYADGRLAVLGVGTGQVYVKAQNAPNSTWGPWSELSGPSFSYVRGAIYNDQRVVAAACGDGTAVWVNAQNAPASSWGGWQSLGGVGFKQLDLVLRTDQRLACFATGGGQVFYKVQNSPSGSWTSWIELTGPTFSYVRAVELPDGRMVAFANGEGTAIWINYQLAPEGVWSGWQNLGGNGFKKCDPVVMPDGKLVCFGSGDLGSVFVNAEINGNGPWGGWQDLAAYSCSSVNGLLWQNGKLACFTHGPGSNAFIKAQIAPGGSWSSWTGLGGSLK